jgi:3-methylcrotonyl-CoA carboxylase alpha subunit
MLAKVIVHADTRHNAICLMAQKLDGLAVWPVKTNAGFLHGAVSNPVFAAGDVTTSFIADHEVDLIPSDQPSAAVLATAAKHLADEFAGLIAPGFRLNAPAQRTVRLRVADKALEVAVPAEWPATYSSSAARGVALVTEGGQTFAIGLDHVRGTADASAADGAILAPMPGKVIALDVAEDDIVAEGQRLMVLEAMKMEHALTAPFAGTVRDLAVTTGAQVEVEQQLARVEQTEED